MGNIKNQKPKRKQNTQTKKPETKKNQSQDDDDDDYSDAPKFSNVPEFKCAAISYIAGYVAQIVQKKPLAMFVIRQLVQGNTNVNLLS